MNNTFYLQKHTVFRFCPSTSIRVFHPSSGEVSTIPTFLTITNNFAQNDFPFWLQTMTFGSICRIQLHIAYRHQSFGSLLPFIIKSPATGRFLPCAIKTKPNSFTFLKPYQVSISFGAHQCCPVAQKCQLVFFLFLQIYLYFPVISALCHEPWLHLTLIVPNTLGS